METPTTTYVPVSKLRFGASARDSEGQGGSFVAVVVSPTTYAIIAVGLRFGFFGRTVYAPVDWVTSISEAGMELKATRLELGTGDKAPAGVLLDASTIVSQNGKRVGKLSRLSFNSETHTLRHLLVDHGMGAEYVVAATSVSQITTGNITLTAASDSAHPTLTSYRPDDELHEEVQRAIESYNSLRVDLAGIHIAAIDGVVWLRGHVSSELNRRLAGDLASGVRGIGELRNELITDPELAAAISSALANDPRTAKERIGVYPLLGTVRLRGAVHTALAREGAEELARAIHRDGEVVNDLRVDPNANVLPVMSGVTNAEDAVPGGR
jgi:osmotically-inducible protein OsmY